MTTSSQSQADWPSPVKAAITAFYELLQCGERVREYMQRTQRTARLLPPVIPSEVQQYDSSLPEFIESNGDLVQFLLKRRDELGVLPGPWHSYLDNLQWLEFSVRRWRTALADCRRVVPNVGKWTDDQGKPPIERWTGLVLRDLNRLGGFIHPLEIGDLPLDLPLKPFMEAHQALVPRVQDLKSVPMSEQTGHPNLTVGYAERRDELYRRARELIQAEPEQYQRAGEQLSTIFNAERTQRRFASPLEHGQALFARSSDMAGALISGDIESHGGWFDFDGNQPMEDKQRSARVFVLAFLLLGDPDATRVVTPEMCEFAALRWDTTDDQLGLDFAIDWTEEASWTDSGSPSPRQLDKLERALKLIEIAMGHEVQTAEDEELTSAIPEVNACSLSVTPPIAIGNEANQSVEADNGIPASKSDGLNQGDPSKTGNVQVQDGTYLPAGSFPKNMRARLRMATSPKRKSMRVATRIEDGVVLYRLQDVQKWWPNELPDTLK